MFTFTRLSTSSHIHLAAVLGLVLGAAPAYPLSCGDTITANLTLTSDLGPCVGNGMVIGAAKITVDLH